ncbi:hypothetical protein ACHAPU_004544 [Fusarium lateritium]
MPCCIAIIQYQQCLHSHLYKVGCTRGCRELCPPEAQRCLVVTHHLWLCELCHEREANQDLDDRCNKWAEAVLDIPSSIRPNIRKHLVATVVARENFEDRLCEAKRVNRLEELQWVAEWTYEYGLMLFDVLFKRQWEPRRAMARIIKLRDLRVWDLVVMRDALRKSRELFESQDDSAYWTVIEQFAEHRQRMRKFKLPARQSPSSPPTFAEWGQDSQSVGSGDSIMTGHDDDVILKEEDEPVPTTEQHEITSSLSPNDKNTSSIPERHYWSCGPGPEDDTNASGNSEKYYWYRRPGPQDGIS